MKYFLIVLIHKPLEYKIISLLYCWLFPEIISKAHGLHHHVRDLSSWYPFSNIWRKIVTYWGTWENWVRPLKQEIRNGVCALQCFKCLPVSAIGCYGVLMRPIYLTVRLEQKLGCENMASGGDSLKICQILTIFPPVLNYFYISKSQTGCLPLLNA